MKINLKFYKIDGRIKTVATAATETTALLFAFLFNL
jgi:hypothetical protein